MGFYNILDNLKKSIPINDNPIPMHDIYENFNQVLEEIGTEFKINVNGNDVEVVVCIASFLWGFCVNFAKKMNETFGYEMEALYTFGEFTHLYCIKVIDGKKFFIDSRGITDSEEDFLGSFTMGARCKVEYRSCEDEDIQKIINNTEMFPDDEISDAMCNWILNSFRSSYIFD